MNTDKFVHSIEAFARSHVNVAVNYGIVGGGQCGGRITDLFASLKNQHGKPFYPTVAINSWFQDLEPLVHIPKENRLLLEGGAGCGHKPDLCKKLISKPENQQAIINLLNNNLQKCDAYIITAGLAGGTGTGLIHTLINVVDYLFNEPVREKIRYNEELQERGEEAEEIFEEVKPIVALVTIPRDTDPLLDKANASDEISQLFNLLREGVLRNLIIVYNQLEFNEYTEYSNTYGSNEYTDWMDFANRKIVSKIHEMNAGICYPSDRNFDKRDFLNILTDTPGVLYFNKAVIDDTSDKAPEEKVMEAFRNSKVLMDSANFSRTTHSGYLIVRSRGNRVIDENRLDALINVETPMALTRSGTSIANPNRDAEQTLVYTVSKAAQVPDRIAQFQKEVADLMENVGDNLSQLSTEGLKTTQTSFTNKLMGNMTRTAPTKNPFGNIKPTPAAGGNRTISAKDVPSTIFKR